MKTVMMLYVRNACRTKLEMRDEIYRRTRGRLVRLVAVRLILIDVGRRQESFSEPGRPATPNCCGGKRLIVAQRRPETELGENSSRTRANQQLRKMQLKPTWATLNQRRDNQILSESFLRGRITVMRLTSTLVHTYVGKYRVSSMCNVYSSERMVNNFRPIDSRWHFIYVATAAWNNVTRSVF